MDLITADHILGFLLVFLSLGLVLGMLIFRFRANREKTRRERRLTLLREARQELNPARRRALILAWNDLGGMEDLREHRRRKLAKAQGEQARGGGMPLSANPFATRFWGPGRAWKQGWLAVERNIRWIESHRQ